MTHATNQPASSPFPPHHAGVWARPEMERDLAVLAQLRDLSVAMAEAVVAQARAVGESAETEADQSLPPSQPFTGDLMLAFTRASRAGRMAVALRARLIEEMERLGDLQARRAQGREAQVRAERKDQIARLLTGIIEDAAAEAEADDGPRTPPRAARMRRTVSAPNTPTPKAPSASRARATSTSPP